MIGTINVTVNAQHPNVPLSPVFAWRGSASRINVEGVPCLCGSWYVSAVSIAIATPDGKTVAYPCQRTCNGIYSTTIDGTDTAGKSSNGITITAKDEAGKDYILGRGDLYILDGEAIPAPGDVSWSVRLVENKPENPKDGDAYFAEDGTLMVYSGGAWRNTMPSAKVPTKVSELENDAGYITSAQVKPSTENAGYAENASKALYSNSSDWSQTCLHATNVDWSGVENKPTTIAGYGITDAPTKTSQLENDLGLVTDKQVKLGTTPGYVANADHSVSALSAVDSETVPWSGVKFRPTTLAGYGITDAATKTEVDAIAAKVDAANTQLEEVA